MRISTTQFFMESLNQILTKQRQVADVRNQLATGKRILTPADDPAAATRIVDINRQLQVTEQHQSNADLAISRLSHEESVLVSVGTVLQRVRELALQARSEHLTDEDRSFIAAEVRQRPAELMALGNSRDANGEHIFAGFQSQAAPFTANAGGGVNYNGDQGRRHLQISADRQIADRDNGHDVFMAIRNGNGTFVTTPNAANLGTGVILPGGVVDAGAFQPHDFRIVFTAANTFDVINDTTATTVLAGQNFVDGAVINFNGIETQIVGQPVTGDEFNVNPSNYQSMFETVERFALALETPITSPQVEAAFSDTINRTLVDIDLALEKVLQVRTTVGARLNTLDTQKQVNDDFSFELTNMRASLEDLDVVEAAVNLNINITALQAAQQALIRTQNLSLFNLL